MNGTDESGPATTFLTRAFISLALLTLVAIALAHGHGPGAMAGIALVVLLASFLIGTLLGFLFSVPRVLARGAAAANEGEVAAAGGSGRQYLQTNSNLERISDWLTTLLVGAGLSQLHNAGDALLAVSDFVRGVIPAGERGDSILPGLAPFVLLIGLVLGFLAMYLYTRVYLSKLFGDVEDVLDRSTQRALAGEQRAAGLGPVPPATRGVASDEGPSDGPGGGGVGQPAGATTAPRTVDDALDLMFRLLYQPDGYRRVLTTAEPLKTSSAASRPDYWFYVAAAYGQQYAAALAAGDQTIAGNARTGVLDAAGRAVKLDVRYRERLWSIANPAGPDDDLASLRDDPDFLKIVGKTV